VLATAQSRLGVASIRPQRVGRIALRDWGDRRDQAQRAERRIWIEWLLLGKRRFWVALGFVLALALVLAVQLLYVDGVSHHSTYGPLLERLHSE
jgi:hypothetical protein